MKIIAFYLPQFHSIPENDIWWGKGFTEWSNTKNAKPNFKGHYQPHEPLNDNYYNLLDIDTQIWQANLAKKYGVFGFCYYHYWFKDGKKLLEKPIENMLAHTEIDIPFCLCWANETWSRRWDGSDSEILMKQDYGTQKDWGDHYLYLRQFFKDERYIKIDGKPLLLIYKPQEIAELDEMLEVWNKIAMDNGDSPISYAVQYPQNDEEIEKKFDYVVEFEPQYTADRPRFESVRTLITNPKLFLDVAIPKLLVNMHIRPYKLYSYNTISTSSMKRKLKSRKHLPGAFTSWDNTARKKMNSIIYEGSSPEQFEKYIQVQLSKKFNDEEPPFLFINAWNEWAEGAHLEPDKKYGLKYLEALKNAVDKNCPKL